MSTDPRQPYRTGLCDAFALAAHRRSGWNMGLWVGHHADDMGEPGDTWQEAAHAVVCEPATGRWLDVDGLHDQAPDNLLFSQPPLRVSLEPANEDEIRFAFSMEGVDEEQILQAEAMIVALGLDALLTPPGAPRQRHGPRT